MNTHVAIAVGSNLGDRQAAIAFATRRLAAVLDNLTISSIVETEPEGEGTAGQPWYLNAAIVGDTTLDARSLLDSLLSVEREFGRQRPRSNAPRTLDLDLVLFGDSVINEPGLQVPHPRFRDRFFVLGPLAEVGPEMPDPVTSLNVAALLQRLLGDERR